jgi:hypothetical protein
MFNRMRSRNGFNYSKAIVISFHNGNTTESKILFKNILVKLA